MSEVMTVQRLLDQGAVAFKDIPLGGCFYTIGADGKPQPGLNRRQEGVGRADMKNVVVTFPPDAGKMFGSQYDWTADPWLLVYPIAEKEGNNGQPQTDQAGSAAGA